jgi:hypothetical protein
MSDSDFRERVKQYRKGCITLMSICMACSLGALLFAVYAFWLITADDVSQPYFIAFMMSLSVACSGAGSTWFVVHAIDYAQAKDRILDHIATGGVADGQADVPRQH